MLPKAGVGLTIFRSANQSNGPAIPLCCNEGPLVTVTRQKVYRILSPLRVPVISAW